MNSSRIYKYLILAFNLLQTQMQIFLFLLFQKQQIVQKLHFTILLIHRFKNFYLFYYILFLITNLMENTNIDFRSHYQNNAKIFVKTTHTSRERHGFLVPAIISQIPQDAEICADLGCGNAYYHNTILQKRPKISKLIGIDFSSSMLQMVPPQIKSNPKTQYILQDLTLPLSLKEQYFDCLVSILTLEYITPDKMKAYINNCYKMLKPNGKMVIFSCEINNYKKDSVTHKNTLHFQIISDKEILQDGGSAQVKIQQNGFRAKVIYWQNKTLLNYLKIVGFQGKIEQIKEEHIDKLLFSQKEIKAIVDSKGWRLVVGTKKQK